MSEATRAPQRQAHRDPAARRLPRPRRRAQARHHRERVAPRHAARGAGSGARGHAPARRDHRPRRPRARDHGARSCARRRMDASPCPSPRATARRSTRSSTRRTLRRRRDRAAFRDAMIVHFDLDAFYASVAQRDDPALRGVPLAVSGSSRRAVVLTASYEARPFGVRSAMPLYRALELCPHLVVVPPNFTRVSRELEARVRDLRGRCARGRRTVARRSLRRAAGRKPRRCGRVRPARTRADSRRGGFNGERGRRDGQDGRENRERRQQAGRSDDRADQGPKRRFSRRCPWGGSGGSGRRRSRGSKSAGIRTIGDVAALDERRLFDLFGRGGAFYRELARGIDDREVDPSRERKSISTEETFEYDERDEARILALLRVQADELARDLQAKAAARVHRRRENQKGRPHDHRPSDLAGRRDQRRRHDPRRRGVVLAARRDVRHPDPSARHASRVAHRRGVARAAAVLIATPLAVTACRTATTDVRPDPRSSRRRSSRRWSAAR